MSLNADLLNMVAGMLADGRSEYPVDFGLSGRMRYYPYQNRPIFYMIKPKILQL